MQQWATRAGKVKSELSLDVIFQVARSRTVVRGSGELPDLLQVPVLG
jgi:hypothetical protein